MSFVLNQGRALTFNCMENFPPRV